MPVIRQNKRALNRPASIWYETFEAAFLGVEQLFGTLKGA